jgi:UDP-GlcNAc:undecaprenyl-phosphate GlcNAc-1-phosphate transferase
VFLAILLGATAGFLVYNVYPASIFMGDSGSLLLGFSLAALTLSTGHDVRGRSDILAVVAGPVLVLLIPILDATLVTLARWTAGRRASQGGTDHSSHRLVAIGLSEPRAVALLWFLAAVGGALGIGLRYYGQQSSLALVAFGFVIAMTLFAVYLAGVRVYDEPEQAVTDGNLTPIIVEFMYKRRVAEVVLDFCLATACYYAAYRMRFEDAGEFPSQLRYVSAVAAGRGRDADDHVFRRRDLPGRMASFRSCRHDRGGPRCVLRNRGSR